MPKNILNQNSGYGIIETLLVIIVMGVLTVVFIDRFEKTSLEAKKTALNIELRNLRESITFFKITKGRYPKDLKELIKEEYVLPYQGEETKYTKPLIRRRYLEPHSLDERMNILDPFGLPYLYFPFNGSVRSQAEGFEHY